MLLRHHEKTQDLEYRQQKSVHALREDQVRLEGLKAIIESISSSQLSSDKQTARKRAEESKRIHGTCREGTFAKTRYRAEATTEKPEGRNRLSSLFSIHERKLVTFFTLAFLLLNSKRSCRYANNSVRLAKLRRASTRR